MNVHVQPDPVSGNEESCLSPIEQLAYEWRASLIGDDDNDDQAAYRRIVAAEENLLAVPLKTLADIADAADILETNPDFDDSFIAKLALKVARAVKELHGADTPSIYETRGFLKL